MALSHRGLSLIEVLIVVTLIAVMMALSLPMLGRANAQARSTLCRQNLYDMGQAVATYTRDAGQLPTIQSLPIDAEGLSLAELVSPHMRTPHALFCPSDETEASQTFGTSYHWSSGMNGLSVSAFEAQLDRPVLADRENFHRGPDLFANQLVLTKGEAGYALTMLDGDSESRQARGDQPRIPLGDTPRQSDERPTTTRQAQR